MELRTSIFGLPSSFVMISSVFVWFGEALKKRQIWDIDQTRLTPSSPETWNALIVKKEGQLGWLAHLTHHVSPLLGQVPRFASYFVQASLSFIRFVIVPSLVFYLNGTCTHEHHSVVSEAKYTICQKKHIIKPSSWILNSLKRRLGQKNSYRVSLYHNLKRKIC